MKDLIATVTENKQIAENIYSITLALPQDVGEIHGGQFLNISTGDSAHLLRRPFGVLKYDNNEVTVCYQIKGGGTKKLMQAKSGDKLSLLLPLGNWFDLEGFKSVAVVGGGVGIFPLIATISENCGSVNFDSYIGFRNNGAVCLLDELEKSRSLTVTTDDGSYGKKGNSVEAFLADWEKLNSDAIIACGPPVMLKILKQKLKERGITAPCFVSLEERMGCGLGACLVCVCKGSDGDNLRVCRDGPVFDINDVEL